MVEKNIAKCSFSLSILAVDGLWGITQDIDLAGLNLYLWESGYNGKVILRSQPSGPISLEMDSSDTEEIFGSGMINLNFERAKEIIDQFSGILQQHELPHEIFLDNETGEETYKLSYQWEKS